MQTFEIVWLGVVIEIISSNCKVIATCADSYITDIFFTFKQLQVCNKLVDSALDKLLGQLGIYATWLSSIAYLQKQWHIFIFVYATFLTVITHVFLLCLHIYCKVSFSAKILDWTPLFYS